MANSKDSDESARDTAMYPIHIGSCDMLDIEPYEVLHDLLPRLCNAMTKEQLTAMLPYKIAEGLEHDRLQANNHCGTVRI